MASEKSDNRDDMILLIDERNEASQALCAQLETQRLCGIIAEAHRQWRGSSTGRKAVREDPAASITSDIISPIGSQWHGRLRVTALPPTWTTAQNDVFGMESPALNSKLGLAKAGYNQWYCRSNMLQKYDAQVRHTIVGGFAFGRQVLVNDPDEMKETGGWRYEFMPNALPVTDPTNSSEDWWEHEYLIINDVISLDRANSEHEVALKAIKRWPLKGGTPMGTLTPSDQYVNATIRSQQPGYGDSKTLGVIRRQMWDKCWKRYVLVLVVPEWKEKDRNGHETTHEKAAHKIFDGPWEYGNPFLKTDCLTRTTCAYGQSLYVALTPMQNLNAIMERMNANNVLLQGMTKILVLQNAVLPEDESKLTSSEPMSYIRIKGSVSNARAAVYPMTFPRTDNAALEISQRAVASAYRLGTIEPSLLGQTRDRQPLGSQELSITNALVPLDAISDKHRKNVERFFSNAMDSTIRHHGVGSRPSRAVWVFGDKFAGIFRDRKYIRLVAAAGPIACHMPDWAFKPETVESIANRLDRWLTSGRLSPEDAKGYIRDYFLLTGRQMQAGQQDRCDAALYTVGRILRGENPDIGIFDDHEFIEWMCQQFIYVFPLRDYSLRAKQYLEHAIRLCRELSYVNLADKASRAHMLSGGVGAGAGEQAVPPESGAAPGAGQAPMGEAAGASLVAAAG